MEKEKKTSDCSNAQLACAYIFNEFNNDDMQDDKVIEELKERGLFVQTNILYEKVREAIINQFVG